MTDRPLFGEIENGRVATVVVDGVTARAGVRDRGDTLEVAFLGRAPRAFPIVVTIDGVECQAIGKVASVTSGMTVLDVVRPREA